MGCECGLLGWVCHRCPEEERRSWDMSSIHWWGRLKTLPSHKITPSNTSFKHCF